MSFLSTSTTQRRASVALLIVAAGLVVSALPRHALAQAPPPERVGRIVGSNTARLETRWSVDENAWVATVRLTRVRDGESATTELARGSIIRTALALSRDDGDTAFIGLLDESDGAPRVRAAFVSGNEGPRWIDVARPAGIPAGFAPAQVVAAATPDGFTMLWQEQDANASTGYTVLARFHRDGRPVEAPRRVEVPWQFVALEWNGHGYHLALLFGGNNGGAPSPGHSRICLVTLSVAGAPEQHPWWATQFAIVSEVLLVANGSAMELVWRSGRDVFRSSVTTVGHWGAEPARVGRAMQLGPGETIAAQVRGPTFQLLPVRHDRR